MEHSWELYFTLPKKERNGIMWEGRLQRVAVFEDKYLAKCKESNINPNEIIKNHFWKNCVEIQGYEPQYCNNKDFSREK